MFGNREACRYDVGMPMNTASPLIQGDLCLLKTDRFAGYIEHFAKVHPEEVVNAIPDRDAWAWMQGNVPFLECSDAAIEEIYYYRWWIYRKHIKPTPDGYVITEFLPLVGHGGKHNTINCPVGHQLYEGRWIKDTRYVADYARFMLTGGGELHAYSCWFADGLFRHCCATGDMSLATALLEELCAYYRKWEGRESGGLFHYTPWMDGMEFSISGNQEERFRPTFNAYMYGDSQAIAEIATLAGREDVAAEFRAKAAALKEQIQSRLWNQELEFFASLDMQGRFMPDGAPVREEVGYVPWYFHLPDAGYEVAWRQFNDPGGFCSPIGLTSAEIRHPRFLKENPERLPTWDGPIWPFATSQTLTALQNVLRDYDQPWVTAADYMRELHKYAASHTRDGKPDISEVIRNPYIAQMAGSQHYNHSTFCDLVITGAGGLVPRNDETLEISPLFPAGCDYFCLDGVRYRGRLVTIAWDRTGIRYGKTGLSVYVDKELRHSSDESDNRSSVKIAL